MKYKFISANYSKLAEFGEISDCLKQGKNVMFVGTPCQVSAVKNLFSEKYKDQLFLIDFLCHGTGTQKCFDICIRAEEKKQKGKITDFMFRAKSKSAEHSYKYTLIRGDRKKTVTGYSFEFPYYHSYLRYCIFNEACYECPYARKERVGDITLGDFWKIQKYNKSLSDQKGVSMLSVNTQQGRDFIKKIRNTCIFFEQPIENAAENNEAFRSCVSESCRDTKHKLVEILENDGEFALVEKFSCSQVKKNLIYAHIPLIVKKIWNQIRG